MSFKQEIEKLVERNLKTYRDNTDRFIADYNRELELTKEYNGRQLLELLQNADDAGSSEVEIIWDKSKSSLTISNKGEAFSVGGIKSLMLANLSTKIKITYIGNKGLGFRSILNWAKHIHIYSNSCRIAFSESISKEVFENQLELSKEEINSLRRERNLSSEAIPFPTLAVPQIEEINTTSNWATSIEILCKKEFEEDIEKQLAEIREEILLFLNKIGRITINNVGKELVVIESKKSNNNGYELISIKEKQWKVFTRENILPSEFQDTSRNEQQSYCLKVAFQENLADDYKKLFNFFPTQLSISLPCIIHGTFELNSSRNHLNDSRKNEFIIKELVGLLKDCSIYLTKQKIDWRPYKLLTPTSNSSDSKLIDAFYKQLVELKQTEIIYPCINNTYKAFPEIVYYTDEFNSFFLKHFPSILPELLIPLDKDLENTFKNEVFEHDYLVSKIDDLSKSEIDINLRAELIAQLAKVIPINTDNQRFSLLVDDENALIDKSVIAFTPVIKSEEEFKIPKSVDVGFMNFQLYEILFSRFENEYDKAEKDKRRELQRIIKHIVNIQPYDSNNVIDKIIVGTKDSLKSLSDKDSKIVCIKEMVLALFVNFKNIENRQERLKIGVPLISRSNDFVDAENLFLNKTFPSGQLTEIIYEGVHKSNDYINDISFWGLEKEDVDTVEYFFLWLGVNKFSKISTINLQNNWDEKDFIDFIFANGTEKPDNFEINRIQKDSVVSMLDRFEEIKGLQINKLLLLVLKDGFLRNQLEVNDERISWYYVTWRPPIISNFSYIRFQFLQTKIFSKYILEEGGEELNRLINEDFQLDYDYLSQFGINKAEVKSILIKLGANESFNDLLAENIYSILKAIPSKDTAKKGRSTQTIYKMALDSLVKQETNENLPNDLTVFSKKGDLEEYQPIQNVYYSDNTILPKKILDTLFILNLPKRSGEDNVEKYFGVKSLREFKLSVNQNSINLNIADSAFNKFFDQIKAYILAYRLNSTNLKKRISDNETKRKEARILKNTRIYIVNDCTYNFGDKEEISIEENEYINVKDEFYFKQSNAINLESLKGNFLFCDAFAEMMCIIFKVNDLKNEFRQILKNDLADTNHVAKQDLGEIKLDEAYQLLGISRIEIEFWNRIFKLKDKYLPEPIDSLDDLKTKIKSSLGINISEGYGLVDFEFFNTNESFELIETISKTQSLQIRDIVPNGIFLWHQNQFAESIKNFEFRFKSLLWAKLSSNKDMQSQFISILNDYTQSLSSKIVVEIQKLQFELNVDYDNLITSWINKMYEINVNTPVEGNTEINNLYQAILDEYSIEEVDISNVEIRSLLYFENNREIIEDYLRETFPKKDESEEDDDSSALNPLTGNLINATLSFSNNRYEPTQNSNGTWLHSSKGEKGKHKRGKAAELLVYNTLVKHYGIENVIWVSGNSNTPDKNDKLHYDIRYKNENGEWKYLEVKAMSEDSFIISNSEKEKGLSEPDKFEMALVKEGNIYIVKSLFQFASNESFENNSKFKAQPKDYIFTFKLNDD